MALNSPAGLLGASAPARAHTMRANAGTAAAAAAELFAARTGARERQTRDLYVENMDQTAGDGLWVLVGLPGIDWATATEAAAKALLGPTTYLKALYVPPGAFKSKSFEATCCLGVIRQANDAAFLAVVSDL